MGLRFGDRSVALRLGIDERGLGAGEGGSVDALAGSVHFVAEGDQRRSERAVDVVSEHYPLGAQVGRALYGCTVFGTVCSEGIRELLVGIRGLQSGARDGIDFRLERGGGHIGGFRRRARSGKGSIQLAKLGTESDFRIGASGDGGGLCLGNRLEARGGIRGFGFRMGGVRRGH